MRNKQKGESERETRREQIIGYGEKKNGEKTGKISRQKGVGASKRIREGRKKAKEFDV